MAGAGAFTQQIFTSLGRTPVVPGDELVGKASLSRHLNWVYSDLIISTKPDIADVETNKLLSLTNDDRNVVTTGNALTTQLKSIHNNIVEENFLDGDPDSIRLQEAIIKVDATHLITKTNIAGSLNNPHIEYYGPGGFTIAIDANIASSWARVMPERTIKKLEKILSSNQPLVVASRFLNFYGITRIFIESRSWPQRAGFVNQQKVQFTATSVSQKDRIDLRLSSTTNL